MALTKFLLATNIIAELPDRPVTDGGLTVAQFKAKFDANSQNLKEFLNDTLISELDTHIASALTTSAFDAAHRVIYVTTEEPQAGDPDGIYLVYEE